jgi:hypothetical protein
MSYLGDDVVTKVLKFAVEKAKAMQNQTAFQASKPAEGLADFDKEDRPQRRRQDLQEARKFWKK